MNCTVILRLCPLGRLLMLTAASSLLLTACTAASRVTRHSALIERLRDRGPVALSSENPYLAANLLISKEMESSPELKGFIKHRGAPAAIEVKRPMFSPLQMVFYYPENRQQFELETLDATWVIRGPALISSEKFQEVSAVTRSNRGPPMLAVDDTVSLSPARQPSTPARIESPLEDSSAPKESAAPALAPPSPPSPGALEEDPFLAKLEAAERQRASLSGAAFKSPAFREYPREGFRDSAQTGKPSVFQDRQFIEDLIDASGRHPAEITPKGDLVHHVTYPGETLSMIARWYTFDRENAPRLARINKLGDPDILRFGDEIVVPAYMLKNKNRLTETAVRAFMARD